MRTKKIILELVSDRATIAVVERGHIAQSKTVALAAQSDPGEWVRQLRKLSGALESFVEQHKLTDSPTVVVYQSPTVAVNLASAPLASGADAVEVASLGCLDALPYSSMAAVVHAEAIGRDRSGENRQIHVLVAAERDDVASAIVELVTDAGLKFISATPIDVLVCRRLAANALRNSGDVMGYLFLGENSSYFLVGGEGRLEFERRLSFDIHAMVAKLRSPILQSGDSDGDAVEFNRDEARAIVRDFGVPDRKTVVHESIGLTGGQIIPLLQPLLQRLIIELRQSLRFGVLETKREGLPIVLSGPGVSVPKLAETISDELNVAIAPDENWQQNDFDDPTCGCGVLAEVARSPAVLSRFNLQPNELSNQRRVQRLKKWLWTGAAAALAIIAVDYLQYNAQLNDAREQADMLSLSAGDIEALRVTSTKLEETIAALTDLEQRIIAETGTSVSFEAIFNEMTRVTPSAIRLTSFNFNTVEDQIVGRFNGYVFDTDGDDGQHALKSYVENLHKSPLLSDVRLGDVQLGTVDGKQGRRFDAAVTVLPVPRQLFEQLAHVAADNVAPDVGVKP